MPVNERHLNHSEVGAELRALRAELNGHKALMDERDRRYAAVETASRAAVEAALTAADRASDKTEQSLKEYKLGANEWRDTVKDLIGNLRESRSVVQGRTEQSQWTVALVIGGLSAIPGLLSLVLQLIRLMRG